MRQPRPGFTLVETIVALVLLQVAMLALAATAVVAARDFSDGLVRRRVQAVASETVERLRTSACVSSGAGSRSLGSGLHEYWSVTGAGVARAVVDSVTAPLSRGRTAVATSRGWRLCA